jgi:hypothetical protein
MSAASVVRPPISVMRGFCLSESRPGPAGRTAAIQSFDQLATESPYFLLVALVALVTFVGGTYGETLPAAPAADHAALFTAAHAENPLLRSLAATGATHPAPAAPLTSIVVNKNTGIPGEGFIAAQDVPRAQGDVFGKNWLEEAAPSAERFDEAYRRAPNRR